MSATDPQVESDTTHVAFDDLVALLRAIFVANGTSDAVADVLARNCATAERDGSESHGIFRMPGYVSTLRSGWVDGRAVPIVEEAGAAFLRVDARNGFAQPALLAAAPRATALARSSGACVVAIRDSHHFGALWLDVEPFAEAGLVALSVVNSMAVVVPHGGLRPVFGTNPLAFAAPRADGPPLVFDQASSTVAHGDVKIAARERRALPPGVGVDRAGRPTTDPAAVLDGGALLPFGGHKGSSVALMIEILSAALSGGRFSFEVDWSGHPGAQTPRTGQCLILIDPDKGAGPDFARRVDALIAEIRAAGAIRLPGDRRHASRRRHGEDGVPLARAALDGLRALFPAMPPG